MIRQLTTTIRAVEREGNGDLIVEGVANDATVTDSYNTRFVFTDACLERTGNPIVLFNHDPDAPIGRALSLSRTASGSLAIKARVEPEARTKMGLCVGDLVERGVLNGFSIRFDPDADYKPGREYDTITPNYLPEISVVTLPSNTASTFTPAVRSILEQLETTPEGQAIAAAYRLATAPEGEKWSKPALKDFTDKPWDELSAEEKAHIASHFLYVPEGDYGFSDLKLPYKNAKGEVVWDALKAVASRLPSADIPEAAKEAIEAKLEGLYKEFGKTYPESEQDPERGMAASPTAIPPERGMAPDPAARAGAKFSKSTREWLMGHVKTLRAACDDMERAMGEPEAPEAPERMSLEELRLALREAVRPEIAETPAGLTLEDARAILREITAN
jgi:HK97 family phage prohead protease